MRRPTIRPGLALAATLAMLALAPHSARANSTVSLRHDVKFQTIVGWEVVARFWEYDKINNRFDGSWRPMRDQIIDALVNEAGINRVRLEVHTGTENPVDYWAQFEAGDLSYKDFKPHFYHKINDNADPMVAEPAGFQFSYLDYKVENVVLPIKAQLDARGEELYLGFNVVDFKGGEALSNLDYARSPREYGELVDQSFRHLQSRWGLRPDGLEIILEPENTVHWRGREIGVAAANAVAFLKKTGPVPELILPSTVSASNAVRFFEQAIRAGRIAPHTGAIAYHLYSGNDDKIIAGIAQAAAKYGVRSEMLEFTKGGAKELFRDLTVGNVSSWTLYSIIARRSAGDTSSAGSVMLYGVPETGEITLSHQGRELAPVFRAVRRGAVRIGADSDDRSLAVAAFVTPDGSDVVALYNEGLLARTAHVNGLRPGSYELRSANAATPAPEVSTITVDSSGTARVEVGRGNVVVLSQPRP